LKWSCKDITVDDLQKVETRILRLLQQDSFGEEMLKIRNTKNMLANTKPSVLLKLNPYVDKDGLIRVGGRLGSADMVEALKYPVILPKMHPITKTGL